MAPVTTRSGRKPEEYDHVIAYMEDIIEMPSWYGVKLQDQDWINEHIPYIVQHAVPVRALDWGSDIDVQDRNNMDAKYSNKKPRDNVNAMFVYVTGNTIVDDAGEPASCDRPCCGKIFTACVVPRAEWVPHMAPMLRKLSPFLSPLFIFAVARSHVLGTSLAASDVRS